MYSSLTLAALRLTLTYLLSLRSELQGVQDMWQRHLDALLDVQPTLAEALTDRGLSLTGVLLEAAAAQGENTSSVYGVLHCTELTLRTIYV